LAKDCPACTSPHRAEIETRLRAKESVRSVSRWLQTEKNETIAKSTLHKHAQGHLAVPSQFASKVFPLPRLVAPSPPSQEVEAPVSGLPSDSALPPLEALAYVQNKAIEVIDALSPHMNNGLVSPQLVSLFNGTMKEARQSAKHRHELVYGKKYVVHDEARHPALKGLSNEELLRRRDELRRQREERERV
jgi:hypothetical protein